MQRVSVPSRGRLRSVLIREAFGHVVLATDGEVVRDLVLAMRSALLRDDKKLEIDENTPQDRKTCYRQVGSNSVQFRRGNLQEETGVRFNLSQLSLAIVCGVVVVERAVEKETRVACRMSRNSVLDPFVSVQRIFHSNLGGEGNSISRCGPTAAAAAGCGGGGGGGSTDDPCRVSLAPSAAMSAESQLKFTSVTVSSSPTETEKSTKSKLVVRSPSHFRRVLGHYLQATFSRQKLDGNGVFSIIRYHHKNTQETPLTEHNVPFIARLCFSKLSRNLAEAA